MPLTEQQIKNFRSKPGKKTRLFDARGLYLEISPTGGTYWRWKYHYGGKERRRALHLQGLIDDVPIHSRLFTELLRPGSRCSYSLAHLWLLRQS
jgi:hypothetical protein